MAESAEAEFEFDLVESSAERAAVFELRMRVFVEEQDVPPDEELDAYDVTATHFLVRARAFEPDDTVAVIATARLVDKGEGVGKIGRVAVDLSWRGRGLGARLMRFVEGHARRLGYRRLHLEAQCYAIPFYERLGYTLQGDVFMDAGIPHRNMSKFLLEEEPS